MTQSAAVLFGAAVVLVQLPSPETEVFPGVSWGSIDAFPSPAYWAYQVIARRIQGGAQNHRLGSTLAEEVGACLLGGHGIPASVGIAAFKRLRDLGVFFNSPSYEELLLLLSEPLTIDGRSVRYRFARQKSLYLSKALERLASAQPPMESGRELRNWLLELPGVGYKTASWVARNFLDADDVAILDIHVLRAGRLAGFFDAELSVESDYLELESQFLRFAQGIGTRASELDAVIWGEMMASPLTVTQLMGGQRTGDLPLQATPADTSARWRRSHKGRADTRQARLIE